MQDTYAYIRQDRVPHRADSADVARSRIQRLPGAASSPHSSLTRNSAGERQRVLAPPARTLRVVAMSRQPDL